MTEPWIKLKGGLNRDDYDLTDALQKRCADTDKITLKLELDYKLADAENSGCTAEIRNINEFLCFNGSLLIGYMGICSFGGAKSPFEITGMVHPDYRRRGVFSKLFGLAVAECKRRNAGDILALCDRKSASGQAFLKSSGAVYKYSEYEMYLKNKSKEISEDKLCGISLRKAKNQDAPEIARQNRIYFGDETGGETGENGEEEIIMPEDEEKRGVTVYLAIKDDIIVGKVNLQIFSGIGGIYGLGVLPEYRGKGLGRAVLLNAVEKLRESNAKEIMLQVAAQNARALNLYKTCGFEETSVMDYFDVKR
jgi:ribosomal protein S18 acetylase RimI-like enzyme